MARYSAPTGGEFTPRGDFDPYEVVLQSDPELQAWHPEYGQSAKFVWQVGGDANDTIWSFHTLVAINKKTGELYASTGIGPQGPSILRQLISAVAGIPADTPGEIDVDTETLEAFLPGGSVVNLRAGIRVVLRGETVTDGDKRRFKVRRYQPAKQSLEAQLHAASRAAAAAPAVFPSTSQLPVSAPVGATTDEPPF